MKKLLAIVRCFGTLLAVGVAAARSSRRHADSAYVLKVEAPAAKKGQKAVAKVHITPGAGFHMNKEYPDVAGAQRGAGRRHRRQDAS